MIFAEREVLLCDCGGTMPLDAEAIGRAATEAGSTDDESVPVPEIHHRLCRDDIAAVRAAAAHGRCLVACTRETTRFRRAEAGTSDRLDFVDIRGAAGWSSEAAGATAKIVAVLAAATIGSPSPDMVMLSSAGHTLVYGHDQTAIDAAMRLPERLDVVLVHPATIVAVSAVQSLLTGKLAGKTRHFWQVGRLRTPEARTDCRLLTESPAFRTGNGFDCFRELFFQNRRRSTAPQAGPSPRGRVPV